MSSNTNSISPKNSGKSNLNGKFGYKSSISDFFDLTDIKRNEDFKKKLRGLGRIYPLLLILMLVLYILLVLLTGFLILVYVIQNPLNIINSRTVFTLITCIISFVGIFYALWGIIAYSNGSAKHFKVFNMALAALIIADSMGMAYFLVSKRKMIYEMFGIMIFLLLKLFLYVKSTKVKQIIIEYRILESLKTKAKV